MSRHARGVQRGRRSLENAANHFAIIALLGVSHEQTDEVNLAALRRLWSREPQDAEHRAAVQRALRAQSWSSTSTTSSTATRTRRRRSCRTLRRRDTTRTRSGSTSRPPAAARRWRTRGSRIATARRAIRDLVAPGRFLLIAGEDGHAWVEAARAVADQTGLPLDAIRLGHLDGDVLDPQCTWARHRETGADGAVLVRPDRFVAWRRPGAAAEPARALTAALAR